MAVSLLGREQHLCLITLLERILRRRNLYYQQSERARRTSSNQLNVSILPSGCKQTTGHSRLFPLAIYLVLWVYVNLLKYIAYAQILKTFVIMKEKYHCNMPELFERNTNNSNVIVLCIIQLII